jgi:hypothetical protein
MFQPRFLAKFISCALLAAPAQATQIVWDGPAGRNHTLSTGASWPDLMTLELGVFNTGFNPTPANMASWAANWNRHSAAVYDGTDKYFSGVSNFTSNSAPFTAGASAYVWGIKGSEWVLYRKTTWVWPTGSPLPGPATTWSMDSTVTTVIGSVIGSGSTFTLRTAVSNQPVPLLCYADWKPLVFTASQANNIAISGPDADPDADGRPNILEYMASTRPTIKSPRVGLDSAETWVSGGQNFLAIRLKFDPRACFTVTGQKSSNLATWEPLALTTQATAAGLRVYTGPTSISQSPPGREFMRLQFAP